MDVLNSGRIDHLPILLSTRDEFGKRPRQGKLFRFEAKWTKMPKGEAILLKELGQMLLYHGLARKMSK